MWSTIGLALLCLICLLSLLMVEWRGHVRRLAGLQVRVHVHGTRGKTSLTREIAGRLRQRGLRTLARTTGDEAEWILPDGTVEPWKRVGPGRVLEYITILRRAAAFECNALVVECMALQPETMHIASRLLDAHCIVVTNTRPDHQEVMGLRAEDVATTFVNLLPPDNGFVRGKVLPMVVVQQDAGSSVLVAAAKRRGCRVVEVPEHTTPPWERAVALSTCVEQALFGEQSPPDPHGSALPRCPELIPVPGHAHSFLDLFSINDVQSAAEMVHDIARRLDPDLLRLPWVALLATRQDRPLRSRAFAEFMAAESLFPYVLPAGSHFPYTWLHLPRSKRLPLRLCLRAAWRGPASTFEVLMKQLGPCVVVGLGNTHGQGERFRQFLCTQTEKEAVC